MANKLVNPLSVQNLNLKVADFLYPVADVSFERVVVFKPETLPEAGTTFEAVLKINTQDVNMSLSIQSQTEDFVRFKIEKLLPSQIAFLRSFLSPRKIGESLILDAEEQTWKHYHGLNESEMFFDGKSILFSYMDPYQVGSQFFVRVHDRDVSFGKVLRQDYVSIQSWDCEWPVQAVSEKEALTRLGEARDIITNFRPSHAQDFELKQKFLKFLSDTLYSAGRRAEMNSLRRIPTPEARKSSDTTVSLT